MVSMMMRFRICPLRVQIIKMFYVRKGDVFSMCDYWDVSVMAYHIFLMVMNS